MALSNQFNLGTNNVGGLSNFTQPDTIKPLPSMANLSPSQTVQGQMSTLMNSNNPLMQRATTRASQAANKRGLLNSSMAFKRVKRRLYLPRCQLLKQMPKRQILRR